MPSSLSLTHTLFFSADTNHFSSVQFYNDHVWPETSGFDFMEHVVVCHPVLPSRANFWRAYFIGDLLDGNYVKNFDGRGASASSTSQMASELIDEWKDDREAARILNKNADLSSALYVSPADSCSVHLDPLNHSGTAETTHDRLLFSFKGQSSSKQVFKSRLYKFFDGQGDDGQGGLKGFCSAGSMLERQRCMRDLCTDALHQATDAWNQCSKGLAEQTDSSRTMCGELKNIVQFVQRYLRRAQAEYEMLAEEYELEPPY